MSITAYLQGMSMPETVPSTIMALRAYQRDGSAFLRSHKRAMLLDVMGLGKTAQAIDAATTPVLVACPSYLLDQWATEIQTWRPAATTCIARGDRWDRCDCIGQVVDWTIINIEMLRDYEFPPRYNTFIVDESHHLRGRVAYVTTKNDNGTKETQRRPLQGAGAEDIAFRTPNVFLLTGTPIKRECDDLYQQLHLLDPKAFSSYARFTDTYCKSIDQGWGPKVVGCKDIGAFRNMLNTYALRRDYRSVGLTKPEVLAQDILVRPSPTWYAVYKKLKDEYRLVNITFDNAASMVRELRRLTFDLKAVTAQAILDDNPNVVFYVYYRESAHALAEELKLPCITGEMQPDARYRTAKSGGAIVATISSLSEGISLGHLDTVAYLETSYLPGDKTQATARVARWSEAAPKYVREMNVYVEKSIDTSIRTTINRRFMTDQDMLRTELER